ncbi:MAG: helix-turn-helix domain-containing protein [Gammaproteobacteria bacterium]|nr:helix-turn-helix domain-containing protein [Gammaproteobacteria bacterium]MBU1602522.1 helix-turn-helix domain-containing protein [Gammaproteobacteria bacterium]MBU2433327.1 helix-turn-helix domain-containing protein [Gammaproteobacteria bacterium]MBU2451243.1 helix-turn-helix domain-containing protein [Gammaproteobacteria bacterium]
MAAGESGKSSSVHLERNLPAINGQCAQVLGLIRQHQPLLSLVLTADHAIPETAARVHDLRAAGWNILTVIRPIVVFRGVERRNVAAYSLGSPEWPAPGFFEGD